MSTRYVVATAAEHAHLPMMTRVLWCRSEREAGNIAALLNGGARGFGHRDCAPSASCGRSHVIVDTASMPDSPTAN